MKALLAAKISLARLHGNMAEQKLDLVQFTRSPPLVRFPGLACAPRPAALCKLPLCRDVVHVLCQDCSWITGYTSINSARDEMTVFYGRFADDAGPIPELQYSGRIAR
jgi:hypothetical protein